MTSKLNQVDMKNDLFTSNSKVPLCGALGLNQVEILNIQATWFRSSSNSIICTGNMTFFNSISFLKCLYYSLFSQLLHTVYAIFKPNSKVSWILKNSAISKMMHINWLKQLNHNKQIKRTHRKKKEECATHFPVNWLSLSTSTNRRRRIDALHCFPLRC